MRSSRFQSTRLREARPADTRPEGEGRRRFNPRACVRRDYPASSIPGAWKRFNPRACVRRDLFFVASIVHSLLFQSTRLREARPGRPGWRRCPCTFQSTRLREARLATSQQTVSRSPRFQSTRLREARHVLQRIGGTASMLFQSTRLREARHDSSTLANTAWVFQSTRLREARQSHHNSLRDKDFFYEIREPVPPLDSKDAGRVGTM